MAVDSHPSPTISSGEMGPLAHRAFAIVIFASAGLALYQGIGIAQHAPRDAMLLIAAGLLLGILTADLLTGLVHWACDTWGDESTPIVGPSLIYSFREHHREPRAMLDHDWVEVNGHAALLAGIALALLSVIQIRFGFELRPLAHAWLWSSICCSAITNQLHYWSHTPRPPRIIRALQRARVILAIAPHAIHHRAPHTNGYCITTGWLNGTLDAIQFWRLLERAVALATNTEVPNQPSSRDSGPESGQVNSKPQG
jgi:hypothetical protein